MERIRPTSVGSADKPAPATRPATVANHVTKAFHGPSAASKVLVILLIVASVVFIANMTLQLMGKGGDSFGSAKVDKNAFQALFLTNGQVYFGKLSDINSEYVKLTDIYYLQVNQPPGDGIQPADDQTQPQVSLAKLGRGELHGPQDAMFVSREQVLFWENLKDKDNSQVTKAIEDFKAQQSSE